MEIHYVFCKVKSKIIPLLYYVIKHYVIKTYGGVEL
jgi:hypothetical protein